jgi:hypothetical protein
MALTEQGPPATRERAGLDAWRLAANCLSVGQTYLGDAPEVATWRWPY